MKAVVYEKYGSADELNQLEVDIPNLQNDEVLVRVKAVSLNASDCEFLSGRPLYTRAWGLTKPRRKILGTDISGIVEEVGKDVSKFKAGDEVFGDIMECFGGLAEFVAVPEKLLAQKPADFSHEEASAIPQASIIALQGLQVKNRNLNGLDILINGAGGGAGSFAIQIANYYGAKVTGVDNEMKLEFMKSLGANYVFDYMKNDFTKQNLLYDYILDFTAAHSIIEYKKCLKPDGIYVMVGGKIPNLMQTLIIGKMISMSTKKNMSLLAAKPNKGLDQIIKLIIEEKIRPVIERIYRLNEIQSAFTHICGGKALGKIVIQISS